jgi:neutral ceramidase
LIRQKLNNSLKRKKILIVLVILTGIVLVVPVLLFDMIDRGHYRGTAYHEQMMDTLKKISPIEKSEGKLKAGWAKVNITPDFPLQIAAYGLRNDYEGVHDSIWARAFVFDNGKSKAAIVTLELLIFPPAVVSKLKDELPKIGFSLENTFLSATHTHSAPGGWAEGLGGRTLAGKYSEVFVNKLTADVITAIKNAQAQAEDASIGFGKYEAEKFVRNTLTKDKTALDHWLRVIKIRKKSGSAAVIVSYSAHTNVLSSKINQISGDYAGALVDSIEKDSTIDFAAFCAGAVAGHTCRMYKKTNFDHIGMMADSLSKKIRNNISHIELTDSISIRNLNVPLYLPDPQLKISKDLKVRPYIFNFLFGEQEIFISALELGETVLIGTPCDFSGELVNEFADASSDKKINLVFTSFNGGYIGYIIPDKYYDTPHREARDMSWYGPYSGAYFTEIIREILKKF